MFVKSNRLHGNLIFWLNSCKYFDFEKLAMPLRPNEDEENDWNLDENKDGALPLLAMAAVIRLAEAEVE